MMKLLISIFALSATVTVHAGGSCSSKQFSKTPAPIIIRPTERPTHTQNPPFHQPAPARAPQGKMGRRH